VSAIPCQAVVRQHRDRLVLDPPWSVARSTGLLHVLTPQVRASGRGDVGRMRDEMNRLMVVLLTWVLTADSTLLVHYTWRSA
jgi:hypothetical protein